MRHPITTAVVYFGLLTILPAFFMFPFRTEAQTSAPDADPKAVEQAVGIAIEDGPFSLERCIDIALAKSPDLAAAKWDMAVAQSRLDAARSAFWPQVSIEGGFHQYLDSQRLVAARKNGELGVFDDNIRTGHLVAKMNLYSGGRTMRESGAAEKVSEAGAKDVIHARNELIYGVTHVFYSILGQQKIISSLEFSKRALEEHMKRVSELFEVQKAARVDILRTEVRLADLEQNLIKEKNTLAVQQRLLFSLMGLDALPRNAVFEERLDPAEMPVDMGRLVETALQNRPDFQSAKDRMEAQAMRVEAAKAGHMPRVDLVGSYGVRDAPSPENAGMDAEWTEDVGYLGIALTIPLFEGGRVSAKVREETAALRAARERLRKLELRIRQETESAYLEMISNTARIQTTETSVEQSRESFRIESLKYDLGKGSITDVLDAQSAQLQAETAYYRALIDHHISRARLQLATGGIP